MSEKWRYCFRVLQLAVLIYVIFRYVFPLVMPFLFALLLAILLKPSACWISRHLSLTWHGKRHYISIGIIGGVELLGILAAAVIGCYRGGKLLYQQIYRLIDQIPFWIHQLDIYLTAFCRWLETAFSLKDNAMILVVREMIRNLEAAAKQGVMPYLMENSVSILSSCVNTGIVFVICLMGVMLCLQEMDRWHGKLQQSMFWEEAQRLGGVLQMVLHAYVRTQGLIMLLTATICMITFWLLGNPYFILAGIGIGLLDALPIFGTGTILIPWALLLFLQGRWMRGLVLLGVYVLCYLIREWIETKMMGDKVGLSPLETLLAIYIGLQLFGLWGVVLGPTGLLLIKEFA